MFQESNWTWTWTWAWAWSEDLFVRICVIGTCSNDHLKLGLDYNGPMGLDYNYAVFMLLQVLQYMIISQILCINFEIF